MKKQDRPKVNKDEEDSEDDDLESEEEKDYVYCSEKKKCFRCLVCAFSVVFELSQSGLFTSLYIAYKFV